MELKSAHGSDLPLRSAAGRSRHPMTWTRKMTSGDSPSRDTSETDLPEIEPVNEVLKARLNVPPPCWGLVCVLRELGLRNMVVEARYVARPVRG